MTESSSNAARLARRLIHEIGFLAEEGHSVLDVTTAAMIAAARTSTMAMMGRNGRLSASQRACLHRALDAGIDAALIEALS